MKWCILPIILFFYTQTSYSQTTHPVTVAINQGEGCPIVNGLDESDVFSIFPNPAESSFTIRSEIMQAEIELLDLNGRRVRSEKLTDGKLEVDIQDLPKGIYILQLHSERILERIKIKIQ